ncbi:type 11 methyltransferase [Lecanosticta acicola]|uniref:Type 11 methyltransferase n=1 Tax=Lecanosticta acicola TaxID=111012 RepID=A0AAI8Z7U4_9PEZI|nr:type 11 methyltransferase [Lecanosticta acicola]
MATAESLASLELFDALEIEYEHAYKTCPSKIAVVKKAMSLMPPGSMALDIGCGTGSPVTELLHEHFQVVGLDISPKMVEHTRRRFRGTFLVADMLEYQPQGTFSAVFVLFSQLMLPYSDFHSAAYRFANALEPGGLFVLGQMPSDGYVADEAAYDETKSYVEAYDAPFMGRPFPTLMLSLEGQREFLRSMGLEIVYETVDLFQPDNPKCAPEEQQYLIARRALEQTGELSPPRPMPRTL